MDLHIKRNAVILLLVALGAALVLSSSLANLQLAQANPFPGADKTSSASSATAAQRLLPVESTLPLFQGLLAVILLGLVVNLLVRLVTFSNMKRLFGIVIALAAVLILLVSLPRVPFGRPASLAAEAPAGQSPSFESPTSPLGRPPPVFVWFAAIAAFAGVAIVAVAALRHRKAAPSVPDRLRHEVEDAVEAIETGADLTNVIERCYLRMTRLIQQEHGLERDHSMTVREFEPALETLGLPRGPLWRLRTLFEAVRYGSRRFTAEEEQDALDSLNAIANFLGGAT